MIACMRNTAIILSVVALTGCQENKVNIVTEQYPEEQKKLASIVQDIFRIAKNKDLERLDAFHLHSPKYTKFEESDVFTRRNIDEARKTENEQFSAISDFTYEVQEFKADVFGDVAITTFYLQYALKLGGTPMDGRERGTLVFVKLDNEWKIAHEHFSMFPPTAQE